MKKMIATLGLNRARTPAVAVIKYGSGQARKDLPVRKPSDNKTRGGKTLVIAGSRDFFGAAVLSAGAAARCGAGYTYLLTAGRFPIVSHPDFILLNKKPDFSVFKAIAIGPGYRNRKKILVYLHEMQKNDIGHLVIDAEALTAIAAEGGSRQLPSTWIVTPHEGELAKLLRVSSREVQRNRLKCLLQAQKKLGCVVVLKGFRTLVADGKSVWEVQSGNPALAKAGTGDVLTGMIVAFLSQGLAAPRAALLGAYIHGLCADHWLLAGNDSLSLLASDLIEQLPQTLARARLSRQKRLHSRGV